MPATCGALSLDPASVPDSLEHLILPCSGLLIMVCIWQLICHCPGHAVEEVHLSRIAKMQRCGGRGSTCAHCPICRCGIGSSQLEIIMMIAMITKQMVTVTRLMHGWAGLRWTMMIEVDRWRSRDEEGKRNRSAILDRSPVLRRCP